MIKYNVNNKDPNAEFIEEMRSAMELAQGMSINIDITDDGVNIQRVIPRLNISNSVNIPTTTAPKKLLQPESESIRDRVVITKVEDEDRWEPNIICTVFKVIIPLVLMGLLIYCAYMRFFAGSVVAILCLGVIGIFYTVHD